MILLLGASGYVGRAFASELRRRGYGFIPLTRRAIDYTHFDLLFSYIRRMRPEFLINAAGFIGRPDEDTCELAREETLAANTLLPQTIARACLMTNTPWGHVSSGGIYSGAKVRDQGTMQTEKYLNQPELRRLWAAHPESIFGFTEADEPNSTFRSPPCSFYSGSKALAEEVIRGIGRSYIWRPGIVFNEQEEPRNFLWQVQKHPRVRDTVNSLSQVQDFVRACLNLWERQAPFGIYNVANPGAVTTRQVVDMIERILKPARRCEIREGEESRRCGASAPRAHCILDVAKLLAAGVDMRPASEALEDSLRNWHWATSSVWVGMPSLSRLRFSAHT
jgi:dTDP-4-dehydrorhamnose reductase